MFRKAGGFVYVVSVLISMEGSLSIPKKPPWDNGKLKQISESKVLLFEKKYFFLVKNSEVFIILKTILNTLTVSMRYEPANAKFFETEVRWKSLGAALKLLGCFDANKTHFEPRENSDFVKRGFDVFEKFFCNMNESFGEIDREITAGHEIDAKLVYICYILRYLYDTAIDSFDK